MECRYCGRDRGFTCKNTRDMEDAAIHGDDPCMTALEKVGWGEKGEGYVRANKAAREMRSARAADFAQRPPPVAPRGCTCDPNDDPPVPCPQKHALADCREAERERNSPAFLNGRDHGLKEGRRLMCEEVLKAIGALNPHVNVYREEISIAFGLGFSAGLVEASLAVTALQKTATDAPA